jgi:hypothetical protein
MSKYYRTREGSLTAIDTRVALTTLASATAESPANIPVPRDATRLEGVIVCAAPDFAAGASAGFFVRLEGDGLKDSPQYVPAGAAGNDVTTGARTGFQASFIPLGVDVVPGNTIAVSAEMVGADIGTAAIGVTLVFTDGQAGTQAGAGGKQPKTFLVEGDIASADTFTALTTRGSETSPSMQLPADWTKITRIIVATSVDMAAAGGDVFILRLDGAAVRGSHDLIAGGAGGQDPQSGSDTAPVVAPNFILENVDIDVVGGDVISILGAMTDNDLGTARMVVCLFGE